MKRLFIAALAVSFVATATVDASSLKNFDGFTFNGNATDKPFDPFELTCKEFKGLNADVQLLVSSWLMGYSSPDNDVDAYIPGDLTDFQNSMAEVCKKKPADILNDVIEDVHYGTDGESLPPACDTLNAMESPKAAAYFLSWALGLVTQDKESTCEVDLQAFPAFGNAMLNQCATTPNASLLELISHQIQEKK